jgi:hypothetical protein
VIYRTGSLQIEKLATNSDPETLKIYKSIPRMTNFEKVNLQDFQGSGFRWRGYIASGGVRVTSWGR